MSAETSSGATPATAVDGHKRSVLSSRAFALPTGLLGWLAGHLMARKNIPMNQLAIALLDVQPDDRILEIGCGPGTAIRMLSEKTAARFIAGVDPSTVMLAQARKRNRRGTQAQRVQLHLGTATHLPFAEGQFTKVFAVNSFHHWSSPGTDLLEVRRVLQDGGLMLLCLRMALPRTGRFTVPGLTEQQVATAQELVRQAGFRDVRTVKQNVGREVTCVLANK